MNLSDLVELQRSFDSRRSSTFAWSSAITEDDLRPLLHNVVSLAGEVGEIANLVKKLDRGDLAFPALMALMPEELADVVIYVIKIAYQSGIDLEKAILEKMAINENRFPQVPGDAALDVREYPLLARAHGVALGLSDEDSTALRQMYNDSRVTPSDNLAKLVAGALLAVEVAKLAQIERYRAGQEQAWKQLEPTAIAVGFSYDQLVDLARHDSAILRLLEAKGQTPHWDSTR